VFLGFGKLLAGPEKPSAIFLYCLFLCHFAFGGAGSWDS
jgi:hypothetical protein